MRAHTLLLIALLLCLPVAIRPQEVPQTRLVQHINEGLKRYKLNRTAVGVYPMKGLMEGRQMVVRGMDNTLTHIGIDLITDAIEPNYPPGICPFVERYLLELLLCRSNSELRNYAQSDGVKLLVNNQELPDNGKNLAYWLNMVKPETPFFTHSDSVYYEAGWRLGNTDELKLRFKRQVGLLYGMDKGELDGYFYHQLTHYRATSAKASVPDGEVLSSLSDNKLLGTRAETYLIEDMKHQSVYRKRGDALTLLFDPRYPVESITNLMGRSHEMESGSRVTLLLEQKGYGFAKKEYPIPLTQLTAWMDSQGCKPYVGFELPKEGLIVGMVLYVNPDLMYNHLLYFEIPPTIWEGEVSRVTTTLYSYIPTHNLKELFAPYVESGRKKFDVILK